MIKKVCVLGILVFLHLSMFAKDTIPQVSILTCSPGKEVYSMYGHNALRLKYDDGRDYVFNYGTFDFRTPNFTVKFIKGKLPYRLSVNYFPEFIHEYSYLKRSVTEQVLSLDSLQVTNLIALLEDNMKPENREYLYDFFYDNCATRIYVIVQKALEGKITWGNKSQKKVSFRSRIKEYQRFFPWTDFGIDIIMGLPADRVLSIEEEMFLPDYVQAHFEHAHFEQKPLIRHQEKLLDFRPVMLNGIQKIFSPINIFIALLLFELLLYFQKIKNAKFIKYYDSIWFLTLFLVSLLILFMWFFTNHAPVKNNLNILWTLPGLLFLFNYSRQNKYVQYAVIGLFGLCIVQSAGFFLWTQFFNVVFGIISLISILKWLRAIKMPVKS